jgi:sulfite reductase beta subunit-like hemoprotein
MTLHLSFHSCSRVRLTQLFRENANQVTLEIEHRDHFRNTRRQEITLYGLPDEIVAKIWQALADDETQMPVIGEGVGRPAELVAAEEFAKGEQWK